MKKKGYYEYGNGIYPLKLWVHIGKDLKELIDSCFDKCKAPDIDYGGVTYADAVRKSDRRRGVLVSFPCKKVMSMNSAAMKLLTSAMPSRDILTWNTAASHLPIFWDGLRLASTRLVWVLVISLN